LTAVAVVPVLALAGGWVLQRGRPAAGKRGGAKALGVLAREKLGGPAGEHLADGSGGGVLGQLTVFAWGQGCDGGSPNPLKKTTKTPKQIAEELNVSYLLTATLRWEKVGNTSRVHMSPELVDVTRPDAPTSKWQQPFDAALTDVFQVQSDIATRVAQSLG